jgi:TctA family transporter
VALAVGVFGIAEILRNLEGEQDRSVLGASLGGLWPSREDLRKMVAPMVRGTAIGSALGILPGGGAILAAFASYSVEKKISQEPRDFGRGAIAGVAGPESANNAATQSAFIPLFVIGIPFGPVPAILLGALLIHGVTPGPLLISENPALFWAVVASMYIGNFVLLLLNLPFVPLFANMLRVPKKVLLPLVMLFCVTGMYSVNNSLPDIWMMIAFGVLGYLLRGWAYEGAPLLLGLVLGPKLEVAFRQSLMISHGDFAIFVERPVSLALLLLTLVFLALPLVKRVVARPGPPPSPTGAPPP